MEEQTLREKVDQQIQDLLWAASCCQAQWDRADITEQELEEIREALSNANRELVPLPFL